MMKVQVLAGWLGAAALAACAPLRPDTAAQAEASRPGDVVVVRYGQFEWEYQQSNPDVGVPLALQACKAKGFARAERLGGALQQCDVPLSYAGCYHWVITEDYRCSGQR